MEGTTGQHNQLVVLIYIQFILQVLIQVMLLDIMAQSKKPQMEGTTGLYNQVARLSGYIQFILQILIQVMLLDTMV